MPISWEALSGPSMASYSSEVSGMNAVDSGLKAEILFRIIFQTIKDKVSLAVKTLVLQNCSSRKFDTAINLYAALNAEHHVFYNDFIK